MHVNIFVEHEPFNYQRSLGFVSNVEKDADGINVYLTREQALRSVWLLADTLGLAVYDDGVLLDYSIQ